MQHIWSKETWLNINSTLSRVISRTENAASSAAKRTQKSTVFHFFKRLYMTLNKELLEEESDTLLWVIHSETRPETNEFHNVYL